MADLSMLNYRCALDGLGYGTGMETTPAAWCTRTYVVGEARRAGHAGYCSHEHAADAQENEYI